MCACICIIKPKNAWSKQSPTVPHNFIYFYFKHFKKEKKEREREKKKENQGQNLTKHCLGYFHQVDTMLWLTSEAAESTTNEGFV